MSDKLAVILEGGLVQCIVGTGALIGKNVVVIDYDTEGGDMDDIVVIEQGDGSNADAYVSSHTVTLAEIGIPFGEFDPLPADPTAAALEALQLLRRARECLKIAEAPRALDRVRSALSSAKGAFRATEYRKARAAEGVL